MDHKVIWSKNVLNDLESILKFIALDSPINASVLSEDVLRISKALSTFPKRWRDGDRRVSILRHFSDGAIIGSKDFLLKAYATFGDTVIHKKDRNVYPTCIGDRLFSIRKLQT